MPLRSFEDSAAVLDNRRLGKQRVECLQILKALRGETKGWRNHPATLMWAGHEHALGIYLNSCIDEWVRRGFRNQIARAPTDFRCLPGYWPRWIWNEDIFERVGASHRSNLLRKDPIHYGQFGWKEPPDLPYYWPVTKEDLAVQKVLELCP